ncbi:MAG: hypothetical protein NTV25_06875 [Methanothrix sp.]|nr:hypothetical protein [Methanothrix sp.]
MELQQSGITVTGTYTWDQGRIQGSVFGNRLVGTWSESPSYSPTADAGDFEFTLSDDCNSFSGRWRYGSSGEWRTDWPGTREAPACESTVAPKCPIGTLGAPMLRNPQIPSGSLCRGACGSDCPGSCTPRPDMTICIPDSTGKCYFNCTYTGVTECGSHLACREHDDCYDQCATEEGETDILGPCHGRCDDNCTRDYGYLSCGRWALGYGPYDRMLTFSNPPTLTGPFPGPCSTGQIQGDVIPSSEEESAV